MERVERLIGNALALPAACHRFCNGTRGFSEQPPKQSCRGREVRRRAFRERFECLLMAKLFQPWERVLADQIAGKCGSVVRLLPLRRKKENAHWLWLVWARSKRLTPETRPALAVERPDLASRRQPYRAQGRPNRRHPRIVAHDRRLPFLRREIERS